MCSLELLLVHKWRPSYWSPAMVVWMWVWFTSSYLGVGGFVSRRLCFWGVLEQRCTKIQCIELSWATERFLNVLPFREAVPQTYWLRILDMFISPSSILKAANYCLVVKLAVSRICEVYWFVELLISSPLRVKQHLKHFKSYCILIGGFELISGVREYHWKLRGVMIRLNVEYECAFFSFWRARMFSKIIMRKSFNWVIICINHFVDKLTGFRPI